MKREDRLVSLVYLVCLVYLVEPDRLDEPDQLSRVSPVPSVSLGFSEGTCVVDFMVAAVYSLPDWCGSSWFLWLVWFIWFV